MPDLGLGHLDGALGRNDRSHRTIILHNVQRVLAKDTVRNNSTHPFVLDHRVEYARDLHLFHIVFLSPRTLLFFSDLPTNLQKKQDYKSPRLLTSLDTPFYLIP